MNTVEAVSRITLTQPQSIISQLVRWRLTALEIFVHELGSTLGIVLDVVAQGAVV